MLLASSSQNLFPSPSPCILSLASLKVNSFTHYIKSMTHFELISVKVCDLGHCSGFRSRTCDWVEKSILSSRDCCMKPWAMVSPSCHLHSRLTMQFVFLLVLAPLWDFEFFFFFCLRIKVFLPFL